ncbi:putative adhesin [Lentzea sp. NEAU-D7]|uniref:putative adhesin n=1 Tax=Lentzea sp. NEAU-D7 TaxID=2994667 RepID=UPI00224AA1CD|nr:hypothetical protein [Lentzea sp. NEAU-D7]MCX2954560.1 hypothetical protein [Lentzea sp. NEAU-D7]
MTVYLVGHGEYSGSPVEVPMGRRVCVYAEDGTYLAQYTGMAVIEPGNEACSWMKEYASSGSAVAKMPNYELKPLDDNELQRFMTVYSSKINVQFVGQDLVGRLCNGGSCASSVHECEEHLGKAKVKGEACDRPRCWGGVHRCGGLFAKIDDIDIRLVCCLVATAQVGLTQKFTTELSGTEIKHDEMGERAREIAARLVDPRSTAAESAMAELRELESKDPQNVAKLLAASQSLLIRANIYSAFEFVRSGVTADALNHWIDGLPEAIRGPVIEKLRSADVVSPDAQDGVPAHLDFMRAFSVLSLDERAERWRLIESERKEELRQNRAIRAWEEQLLALMDAMRDAVQKKDVAQALNLLAMVSGGGSSLSESDSVSLADTKDAVGCRELAFSRLESDQVDRAAVRGRLTDSALQMLANLGYTDEYFSAPVTPVREVRKTMHGLPSPSQHEVSMDAPPDEVFDVELANQLVLADNEVQNEARRVYVSRYGGKIVFGLENSELAEESFIIENDGLDQLIVRYDPQLPKEDLVDALAEAGCYLDFKE